VADALGGSRPKSPKQRLLQGQGGGGGSLWQQVAVRLCCCSETDW
jgi:hypothetical protein